jgi:hypothetical protein
MKQYEQLPAPQLALPPPEDHREILAWTVPRWRPSMPIRTGCEISDVNGIFRAAYATLTYREEDPAVHTFNDAIPLPLVKVATPEQKQKFLALQAELDRLRAELKEAEKDIADNGEPVAWDWILQHGKVREDKYVPVPHHSKAALANLRRGSRVVIAVQSSAYYKIAGKVGKIVKKGSKDVVVRFGEHQYRIPYPDLKPAAQVSSEERKRAKEGSETSAKVAKQLRGMFQ